MTRTATAERPAQQLAKKPQSQLQQIKEQVVDNVTERVHALMEAGRLHLPTGYSASNAMHAAWLILQDVKTTDGKPALEVCTRQSITAALLRMVVQALDPIKHQCYFIPYGKHLSCQVSYFGDITLGKRMAGVAEVLPLVRYDGEEFKLAVERGRYVVERHVPSIDVTPKTPITHAYAVVEFVDGRPPVTEVMRWDQIQNSWKKSKTYKPDGKSGMHHEQPDQAAIRTVIRRALKPYINASTDRHLQEVIDEIERADAVAAAESEMEIEVATYANQRVLEPEYDDPGDDGDAGPAQDIDAPIETPEPEVVAEEIPF